MTALPSTVEMYDLRMSETAQPLFDAVKRFIADEIEPKTEEFFRLGEGRADRWSYGPGQLEVLDALKAKAKEQGLWNFFLPNAETGEGLSNLDYAYIAVELGKNPIAPECLNCNAPDTGNMEVLERVGTPEQKQQWLEPLLNGEIRSAYVMTEPDVASSDAKQLACRAVRDGDEWVITGEKYWSSGAGDPRCKILIVMVMTDPDAPPYRRQSQILVPMGAPGLEIRRRDARVRRGRGAARSHAPALQRRAGAVLERAVGRGQGLRDQPAPARPGSHPPLHALDRRGRAGARAAREARPQP